MSSSGPSAQSVESVTSFDSVISNTPIGILTAHNATSQPPVRSLILENVQLINVPVTVQGADGVALAGITGNTVISAWGKGYAYMPNGPQNFEGYIPPNSRPSLLSGSPYYQRSKPQSTNSSQFVTLKLLSTGNGASDNAALQATIFAAASSNEVLFIDYGVYKVSSTLSFHQTRG